MTEMDEGRIEQLLRQLRPAGPPPELRARIVSAGPRRAWPWIAAAAAMLLMTIALQVAASSLRQQVRPAVVTGGLDAERERASSLEISLGLTAADARMVAMVDELRSRIAEARGNQERRDQ